MEQPQVRIVPLPHVCPACGLSADDLTALSGHIEHLAEGLTPLEQRQLRSHLFALLAAAGVAD